jgi:hypothetical protein
MTSAKKTTMMRGAGAATGIGMLVLAAAPLVSPQAGLAGQEGVELRHHATFSESFGFVQTVRALSDGRIVVADPLGQVLVRVDMETGEMEPLGREGGGPGEWRQPDAVYALPADSTLLVDLGNTRIAVIDPEGRIVESHSMVLEDAAAGPMGLEIIQPQGTDAAGRIYFEARGELRRPGAGPDSSRVMRWAWGDPSAVRIAALTPPAVTVATSGGRDDQQVMVRPVPLAPQDDWAVAADGSVAVVRAEPYRVQWIHPDGRTVEGPEIDYRRVDVGTPEKERYLDELETGGLSVSVSVENGARSMQFRRGGGGRQQDRAAQMRELDWPETLPAVRNNGALVAPDGRLWVRRFAAAADPAAYDLFDREGRRVGSIALPAGRRVVGFQTDRVYAIYVDELGLNWLESYQ